MAPLSFPLKNDGTELQREAFRNSDLLVVYGSSELEIADPYHANTVLAQYPTGFTIFPIAHQLTTSLVILQDVATVGEELQGRKVVISVSPPFFFLHDRPPEFYAPNYSHLHLSSLVFSADLSVDTKRGAAIELENSPDMLDQDPLLAFAVNRLADGSDIGELLYDLSYPVGEIQNAILRVQDAWDTYLFIQTRTDLDPDVPRQSASIDWQAVIQQAYVDQTPNADNNPFGFDNQVWADKYSRLVPERESQFSDVWFVDNLDHTAEFTDLDLLLKGLQELGAQPLILSQPIPGKYYDFIGISPQARMEYYNRLRALASGYGVPVLDFQNHDEDQYFVTDPNSHLSRVGWAYYDQALDAFYHDALDQLDPAEWNSSQAH
jgi:D-alanine transfer protein